MPAFSISSIRTIGEELKIAVSAIISARDCPPLKAVTAVCGLKRSPASLFAASIILRTASSLFSIKRLSACRRRNSSTDKSIIKFMFCESCATSLLFAEKRIDLSGSLPFINTVLFVGVSFCAAHSISAKRRDFPEPVGPTIEIICDVYSSIFVKFSFAPDLSVPGKMVILRTSWESSGFKKFFI